MIDYRRLLEEHIGVIGGEWRVGARAYCDTLTYAQIETMRIISPDARRHVAAIYGMPVELDLSLPEDVIELRNAHNEVLGRIEHMAAPTLPNRCPSCGDALPDGALYCITCSRPVAYTKSTRRL